MELHERVRYLRKEILKKTQTQFAKELGTSRDAINNIEGDRLKRPGQKEPLLRLMCEKYNIRERWLLTGEGEMQAKVSRQEEITQFVNEAMKDASKTDTQRILTALMDATPAEIAAIAAFARKIAAQATEADSALRQLDKMNSYNPFQNRTVERSGETLLLSQERQGLSSAPDPADPDDK